MDTPGTPEGFEAQINVKMSVRLKSRLKQIEARHGVPASEILRRLGSAAADFFEQNNYLTFPVTITPEDFRAPKKPAVRRHGRQATKR